MTLSHADLISLLQGFEGRSGGSSARGHPIERSSRATPATSESPPQTRDATFLNMRPNVFRIQSLRAGRNVSNGDSSMATQIVMDQSGDTRHHFDAKDLKALVEAERRFKALTRNGFTAATRRANGDVSLLRTFDPNAEETVFYPRLVGG